MKKAEEYLNLFSQDLRKKKDFDPGPRYEIPKSI